MLNRRATLGLLGGAVLGVSFSGRAMAAKPPVYAAGNKIAIHGADPVAYFTDGAPVSGDAAFSHDWNGARWLFASAKNRDSFAADPSRYAPQYGGYCAFAMAHNYIATSVPEAWTVHNGKLYLNYSLGVRQQWLSERDKFIRQADANWPAALG